MVTSASRSSVSASACTPARQSGIDAVSAGECETPVGLRTNSIAVGIPCAERIPASWPAAVGMIGQSPSSWSAAMRRGQVGVEGDRSRDRLGGHLDRACRRARRARSPAGRSSRPARRARPPTSTARPARPSTRDGTALVPLGVTSTRPNVARSTGQPGLLVRGQRGHRVGEHRVGAVLHPRRAGVVGLAGEVEAVAPVRPDLAGHPDRGTAVDQVAALLDVQLHEHPDAVQQPGAAALDDLLERHAVPVPQHPRLVPRHRAGRQPRAQAGQPEPRPLLLDEHRHPDRPGRHDPARPQLVDRRQRRDHAERPVVRPAVQHRVEVRPGQHAGRRSAGDWADGSHQATRLPVSSDSSAGRGRRPARGTSRRARARAG